MPITEQKVVDALAGTELAGTIFRLDKSIDNNTIELMPSGAPVVVLSEGAMNAKITQMGEIAAIRSSVWHETGHKKLVMDAQTNSVAGAVLSSINSTLTGAIANKNLDLFYEGHAKSEAWSYMLQVLISGGSSGLIITGPNNSNITAAVIAAIKAVNGGTLAGLTLSKLAEAEAAVKEIFRNNGGRQATDKLAKKQFAGAGGPRLHELTTVDPLQYIEVHLSGVAMLEEWRQMPGEYDLPAPFYSSVGTSRHLQIWVDGKKIVDDSNYFVHDDQVGTLMPYWVDSAAYTEEYGDGWQNGAGWGGELPGDWYTASYTEVEYSYGYNGQKFAHYTVYNPYFVMIYEYDEEYSYSRVTPEEDLAYSTSDITIDASMELDVESLQNPTSSTSTPPSDTTLQLIDASVQGHASIGNQASLLIQEASAFSIANDNGVSLRRNAMENYRWGGNFDVAVA